MAQSPVAGVSVAVMQVHKLRRMKRAGVAGSRERALGAGGLHQAGSGLA